MSEVAVLRGNESKQVFDSVIRKQGSGILSYLSEGKWHAAHILLKDRSGAKLRMEVSPRGRPQPVNLKVGQRVGVAIKYHYGKFIFDTNVMDLKPSEEPRSGGHIELVVPEQIQVIHRRSYFRVEVPKALKVSVKLSKRRCGEQNQQEPPKRYWEGVLVDISAGGAQVVLNIRDEKCFKNKQFLRMKFTPVPYEEPLVLNAQIRNMLPTADGKYWCLGLQMVGLESSRQGRGQLERLCEIVRRYHQINEAGIGRDGPGPINI